MLRAFLCTVLSARGASAGQSPETPALDTDFKKYSYCLGQDVALYVREMQKSLEFTLDKEVFFYSLSSALEGRAPLLSPKEQEAIKRRRMAELQKKWLARRKAREAERRAVAARNEKKAAAFLKENRRKPGIVATPSGLQYQVLRPGTGLRPGLHDRVRVRFRTTLLDGTEVDSSEKRGGPLSFRLRSGIRAWREGIGYMREGARYRFFIPPQLAYGTWGKGTLIPPGSLLICEIELLQVQKSKAAAPQKQAKGSPPEKGAPE